MPMSGGTRMLRARRKDCNVKPNRRLDRKSSRGMLFENEELRMRTITINAEVEQGQHALKKLRRENEQLRREMWCLRDEYDKMEKLLRKREEGEESDQENSDSDDNYSRTDESDEEKQKKSEGGDLEEKYQNVPEFGNDANVRTFDGLSVIDEQTEETQTTEYGSLSRGNSSNRTLHQSTPDFPPYGCDPYGDKFPTRKKYDNGLNYANGWTAGQCDTYDVRPASPYPYNGSFRPSYQKQFQVLQELPVMPQTPANAIGENGWIFPDPTKVPEIPNYNVYVEDPVPYRENFVKPYDLIQARGGPDVFVSGGYPGLDSVTKAGEDATGQTLENVESEIDKIEISQKSETDPKTSKMTTLTKSAVSLEQETEDGGKLTMDEAIDKNDNGISSHVQLLVTSQNPNGEHVREQIESGSTENMSQIEKTNSKYQTKLLVTLKNPAKAPKKVPGPVVPKTFQPRYMKTEYGMRFQTFPSPGFQPNVRMPFANGRGCLLGPYAGPRGPGPLSGSLPRLPTKCEIGFTSSNIPDELDKELDALPDEESLPVPVTQSLVKPVKIPPVPPPRTSSCPKPIIPPPPIGVTALHQRQFRQGKPLQDSVDQPSDIQPLYNPLLMSQPIATSSPTISLKTTKGPSIENLYSGKFRKQSYNDDSSLEELSKQKLKLKDEFQRADVPKLNKSLSSPSFGSFRTLRRKQSDVTTSVENILAQKLPEAIGYSEKTEKKISKSHACPNNASVSSSSGLDSPTKTDRRKRRVSIQFKKKQSQSENKRVEDEGGGKDSTDSRRDSMAPGILSGKAKHKGKNEETDATTSERERTNSVSSRTSSVVAGSSRRKYSFSSNKTYLNDEKIPWCGCWGNGCV